MQRSGVTRCQRGESVKKYAPDQHAAAPEKINQIAAEKAEHASGRRGNEKQQAHPKIERRSTGLQVAQICEQRPHDQRHHQKFVEIKQETEGMRQRRQAIESGSDARRPWVATPQLLRVAF